MSRADDLNIVENNAAMLKEMLSALGPEERVADSDVIGDVHTACVQMRTRLLSLIESVSNDELLGCVAIGRRDWGGRCQRMREIAHLPPF